MPYEEAFELLDFGIALKVICPDGKTRKVWGCNKATGDLFVLGWRGNVWMDCIDGTLRAEFDRE